jgi:hypothetical protein
MKKVTTRTREPDFNTACTWWPDLPNIWTPVGWKDHMFRFNILWDGSIYAQPHLNRRTETWKDEGLHLWLWPNGEEWKERWPVKPITFDDGMVKQGWVDDDAPVLWSEWSRDGLLLRSSVMVHIPGGSDVQTGVEPLFAWIRLSIEDLCPALPLEESHGFNLLFMAPKLTFSMSARDNARLVPGDVQYPRPLQAERGRYQRARGLRILERNGKVRLAVAPGGDCTRAALQAGTRQQPCPALYVQLPTKKGACVDILLPMIPAERTIVDRELALGYAGARAETRRYWRRILTTPARFEVPERPINNIIRQSTRLSHLLSEKNPATGKYCKINGSLVYANLWTTPGAMDLAMMMDTLGFHKTVERYLDIFREEQGTVTPPGPSYKPHPGYLSTPSLYKSIDWLSDNGAVLYTLCTHALLSGSLTFRERFVDCIVKSCDWIREARRTRNHDGYEGVLPSAVATDRRTEIQALWSDGWNYKGLCSAVRLLRLMRHPRAEEFAEEARSYRTDFLTALRDKCRKMRSWRDARGRNHMLVPTALTGDARNETRHAFYLDTGPLFPVFAGLINANDPLMDGVRLWFREGPPHRFYRRDSNCWQVPALDHEMSSCEPCYSWNVFHSWQLGDRQKFLEGMYSLFAGSVSRKTGISCETRGGITGTVFSAPLAIYMARLAVIDDEIKENELHLLRLTPLAWLKPGDQGVYKAVPTVYGPVTLLTRISRDGGALDVKYEPAFRHTPGKAVLHVPPIPGLKTVRVNGKRMTARRGSILLEG